MFRISSSDDDKRYDRDCSFGKNDWEKPLTLAGKIILKILSNDLTENIDYYQIRIKNKVR